MENYHTIEYTPPWSSCLRLLLLYEWYTLDLELKPHSIDVLKHNPKMDLTTHQQSKGKLIANIIEMLTK
jgi:hypothetical protein